ncbi:MAG: hypothetical protein JWL99_602 [Streptomyces oryziradicis]|nr:hypothetical protein [Actinacidiphila oryziradicis]
MLWEPAAGEAALPLPHGVGQGPCDRDPLPLTARELTGEAAARVRGQAHPVQEPANAVAVGLLAVPEPWLGQNRLDRHGRVQ